jgi:hypothetical protein
MLNSISARRLFPTLEAVNLAAFDAMLRVVRVEKLMTEPLTPQV